MFEYLRDLYIACTIDQDYLRLAVEMEMITEREKTLILGCK